MTLAHIEYARHIPIDLRLRGLALAHSYPSVCDNAPSNGTRRVFPELAWDYLYVQLQPAHAATAIIVDVDRKQAKAEILGRVADCSIPLPSWITVNPMSDHCQAGWILANPVHTHKKSRPEPIAYLRNIQLGYVQLLDADRAFNQYGILRNPVHPAMLTTWGSRFGGYTLHELHTDAVNEAMREAVKLTGTKSRYNPLRRRRKGRPVTDAQREFNRIAGLKSGRARRARTEDRDKEVRLMKELGFSLREIAEVHGITHQAVAYIVRRSAKEPPA